MLLSHFWDRSKTSTNKRLHNLSYIYLTSITPTIKATRRSRSRARSGRRACTCRNRRRRRTACRMTSRRAPCARSSGTRSVSGGDLRCRPGEKKIYRFKGKSCIAPQVYVASLHYLHAYFDLRKRSELGANSYS